MNEQYICIFYFINFYSLLEYKSKVKYYTEKTLLGNLWNLFTQNSKMFHFQTKVEITKLRMQDKLKEHRFLNTTIVNLKLNNLQYINKSLI